MTLTQQFNYRSPGDKFIPMDDWVATLTIAEQEEFFLARERQLARRQRAIDNGHLVLTKDGGYEWTNQEVFNKKSHGVDRVWYFYFHRWLTETNQEFNETIITETK
jgi:hypothetical protein